jgi:hypothetical protein
MIGKHNAREPKLDPPFHKRLVQEFVEINACEKATLRKSRDSDKPEEHTLGIFRNVTNL